MLVYKSIQGQSIYDVCLNTYGSLDYLTKLLSDNGIDSVDTYPTVNQEFIWDNTFVADALRNQVNNNGNITYATAIHPNQIAKSTVENDSSDLIVGGANVGGTFPEQSGGGSQGGITPVDWPAYIGYVDDLNPSEATIKAMNSIPATKAPQQITYNVDSKRFCLAYPSYLGAITSVKDTNQFEIKSGFVQTTAIFTTSGQTQQYTILTLSRKTTQSNFLVTFNF